MVHTVQTAAISTRSRLFSKQYSAEKIYQVIINTEDGDSHEYEVEARNEAEANRKAQALATSLYTDITYIECYAA